LIATATFVGFLFAHQKIPQHLADAMLAMTNKPWLVLLLVNFILLAIGCVIEVSAALIILGPILIPIMDSLGVNLVHFGVVMVVNLAIGTIHPPVGNCLYIVSAISGESIGKCSIAVIPVVGVMVAALLLITFVPELVLFLPRHFGY